RPQVAVAAVFRLLLSRFYSHARRVRGSYGPLRPQPRVERHPRAVGHVQPVPNKPRIHSVRTSDPRFGILVPLSVIPRETPHHVGPGQGSVELGHEPAHGRLVAPGPRTSGIGVVTDLDGHGARRLEQT